MTYATDMAKLLRRLRVYYPIMREAMVVPKAAELIESQAARIAELEPFKTAYLQWQEKTEWVQDELERLEKTATPLGSILGWHRADVMSKVIESQERKIAELERERNGWHSVVKECERVVDAVGTAESPLMSNLANILRDWKSTIIATGNRLEAVQAELRELKENAERE